MVDDQQIVLAGVAALIGAEDDVQVVGTAADLASALALIELTKPDVVLCDVQLGGESGLGLLDHVRPGGPAVLLLSAFEHPSYYKIALEHGASGYVAKAGLNHRPVRNSPWYPRLARPRAKVGPVRRARARPGHRPARWRAC